MQLVSSFLAKAIANELKPSILHSISPKFFVDKLKNKLTHLIVMCNN